MNDVTILLEAAQTGDGAAADRLLPLVYDELRKLAAQRLAREPAGQTLQATALVHDAFVRLVDVEHQQRWESRGHFFAAAAEAMRRILVENARRKQSLKRGGDWERVDLLAAEIPSSRSKHDLVLLDGALERLETTDPQAAALVKLRYFAGLSMAEAGAALGLPKRSAERLWSWARVWLYQQFQAEFD